MKILNKHIDKALVESESATGVSSFEDVEILDSIVEIESSDIKTFLEDITDFDIVDTPHIRVLNLLSRYNMSDKLSYDNSVIISVDDASTINVDDILTFTNGVDSVQVEVVYKETNNLLVKIDISNRQTILTAKNLVSGTINILSVNVNNTTIRGLLKQYTGKYTKSKMEYLSSAKSIDFSLIANSLELDSNKIKTSLTREVLQDIKAYLGKDNEVIETELKNLIIREIEVDAVETMRKMSTKYSLLDLSASYGVGDGLFSVSQDIYSAIKVMTNDILGNLQSKQNMFVVASKDVVNLMSASPLFTLTSEDIKSKAKKGLIKVGTLGTMYDVYIDYYSVDDYILVGTKSNGTDAGLSVRLYDKMVFTEVNDAESGQPTIWAYLRNGISKNPNDVDFDDKSLYFASCEVDTTDLANFPIKKL